MSNKYTRKKQSSGWGHEKFINMIMENNIVYVKGYIDTFPELINNMDKHGATPLVVASFMGDIDIVRLLLEHGALPNIRVFDYSTNLPGDTALLYAISKGYIEIVDLLLDYGVNIY